MPPSYMTWHADHMNTLHPNLTIFAENIFGNGLRAQWLHTPINLWKAVLKFDDWINVVFLFPKEREKFYKSFHEVDYWKWIVDYVNQILSNMWKLCNVLTWSYSKNKILTLVQSSLLITLFIFGRAIKYDLKDGPNHVWGEEIAAWNSLNWLKSAILPVDLIYVVTLSILDYNRFVI